MVKEAQTLGSGVESTNRCMTLFSQELKQRMLRSLKTVPTPQSLMNQDPGKASCWQVSCRSQAGDHGGALQERPLHKELGRKAGGDFMLITRDGY